MGVVVSVILIEVKVQPTVGGAIPWLTPDVNRNRIWAAHTFIILCFLIAAPT